MPDLQDLPTELVHHIILIAAEESTSTRERRRLLRLTSLVARTWRAPSQALLVARVDLTRHKSFESFKSYFEGLHTPPVVSDLSVNSGKQLKLVLGASVGLRSLTLADRGAGASFPAAALGDALVAGITSLAISTRLTGAFSTLSTIEPLDIEHLELFYNRMPPPRLLGQLIQLSPKLTRLTLHSPWYGADFPATLLYIAPQLLHLSIHILQPSFEGRAGYPFLLNFLPSCTSILSLTVRHQDASTFLDLIKLIQHPLKALDTSSLSICSRKQDRTRVELVEAMGLPALAELKRWDIPWKEAGVGVGGQRWLEMCEQRGVELREPRRRSLSS